MKRITKINLWLLGAATLALMVPTQVSAAPTASVDIHVSIAANKSVAITASTQTIFGALPLSSAAVAASSITVVNDSGSYVETYRLAAGVNAISDTGGQDWALQTSSTSLAANQFALAGQFTQPTAPANTEAAWDTTDYVTNSAATCTTTVFGDGNAGNSGAGVSPTGGLNERYLWFRIHTPPVSTGVEGRTAQVTISIL